MIVKLFRAVVIANVAIAVAPDGVVHVAEGTECNVLPRRVLVLHQWDETGPLDVPRCLETGQLGQRRVDIHQRHRFVRLAAGRCYTGRDDDKRYLRRFLPERLFTPAQFLAEMPAVVGP